MTAGSLTASQIETLLEPYLTKGDLPHATIPANLYDQLAAYLDLLLRWNARTNLTAIRQPAEMVTRHFGESLFLARSIGEPKTFLDYGSGAGFPGVPSQLLLPTMQVTLAESQGKKASFLREAIRTLGLTTEVWSRRVEEMPSARLFDVVALRAVDNMEAALEGAKARVAPNGRMAILTSAPLSANGVWSPMPDGTKTGVWLGTLA